uniref:Uncharacterized protein n=1 Tax=Romanomermis culicivorax TaxID=13658 RepID=A0A915L8U5_ROMCU
MSFQDGRTTCLATRLNTQAYMTNDACKYANELAAESERLVSKNDDKSLYPRLLSSEKHYFYDSLEMALFDLANTGEGPMVARSTAKNCAMIPNQEDRERWRKKEMANCLYPRKVYENMIKNSIKTCKKVEKDLNDYANSLMKFGAHNDQEKIGDTERK